jgi:hypothetical protein
MFDADKGPFRASNDGSVDEGLPLSMPVEVLLVQALPCAKRKMMSKGAMTYFRHRLG